MEIGSIVALGVSTVVGVFVYIFNRKSDAVEKNRDDKHKENKQRIEKLEDEVKQNADKIHDNNEERLRDRSGDLKHYATKNEMADVEKRLSDRFDRLEDNINDRLDKLETLIKEK